VKRLANDRTKWKNFTSAICSERSNRRRLMMEWKFGKFLSFSEDGLHMDQFSETVPPQL
jgi:hypothetical protein